MSKKIAFGSTLLNRGMNAGGIDGIGHYCQELLHQFNLNKSEIQIQRYSFGESDPSHEMSLYPSYSSHLLRAAIGIRSQSQTPDDAFQSADLIHATDHLVPLGLKKPLIATVMDVIPLSHPEFIRSKLAPLKAKLWKYLSNRADKIITISEFSKNEIAYWMNYPKDQITAIPLGVDQKYFEFIDHNEIQKILNKHNIHQPFFLFIGSLQPRKNLTRILEGHRMLPGNLSKEIPLVVVGREFWDDGTIHKSLQLAVQEKRCIRLDYVSEWEKRCLLKSALALCFISLYEGFGLPILEAFASGTPVISSNTSSIPEIAGQCATLVDPFDPNEIGQAMAEIINDEEKRRNLIEAGLIRAKNYSWAKTANSTMEIYQTLL